MATRVCELYVKKLELRGGLAGNHGHIGASRHSILIRVYFRVYTLGQAWGSSTSKSPNVCALKSPIFFKKIPVVGLGTSTSLANFFLVISA
jgi:hypothetical protein